MSGDFAPRHFMKTSDPIMPLDVNVVEDIEGDIWQRNEDDLWYHPGLAELSWKHLLSRYGPLTEVIDDVTPKPESKSQEPNEAIKRAWFEIRFAAEQTAEAFRSFNRAFQESVHKEREKRDQTIRDRATELEAEYQIWKSKKAR